MSNGGYYVYCCVNYFKQDLMKIGEYHSDVRSLSCGIISHSTRLDQPCEQKYLMDYKYYNYTLFNQCDYTQHGAKQIKRFQIAGFWTTEMFAKI